MLSDRVRRSGGCEEEWKVREGRRTSLIRTHRTMLSASCCRQRSISSRPVRKTRISPAGYCRMISKLESSHISIDGLTHLQMDVKDRLDDLKHHIGGRLLQVGNLDGERPSLQPHHDRITLGDLLLLVPPRLLAGRGRQHILGGVDARGRDRGGGRLGVEKVDEGLGFDGGGGDDDAEGGADATDPGEGEKGERAVRQGRAAELTS